MDRLLRHLGRKTRSEGSRATYLKTLAMFVRFTELSPEELVTLDKEEVEEKVQIRRMLLEPRIGRWRSLRPPSSATVSEPAVNETSF